jgi:hypothetical protein
MAAPKASVTGAGQPGSSVARGRPERQLAVWSQLAEATVRFLERTNVQDRGLNRHAAAVPLSRVAEVSDEARRRAAFWTQFAELIESRATGAGG